MRENFREGTFLFGIKNPMNNILKIGSTETTRSNGLGKLIYKLSLTKCNKQKKSLVYITRQSIKPPL